MKERTFKTKNNFKKHNERKTLCKPPTHFCSLCRKGYSSRRTLHGHKRKCSQRPGVSLAIDQKVEVLTKKLKTFLNQLDGDFESKLQGLEELLEDNKVVICDVVIKSES